MLKLDSADRFRSRHCSSDHSEWPTIKATLWCAAVLGPLIFLALCIHLQFSESAGTLRIADIRLGHPAELAGNDMTDNVDSVSHPSRRQRQALTSVDAVRATVRYLAERWPPATSLLLAMLLVALVQRSWRAIPQVTASIPESIGVPLRLLILFPLLYPLWPSLDDRAFTRPDPTNNIVQPMSPGS